MNIGIISKQKVQNYGSFLQAWALKKKLESLGNKCYFIDIRNGRILPGKELPQFTFFQLLFMRLKKMFSPSQIRLHRYYSKRAQMFAQYQQELGLSEKFNGRFDLAVIGSDEVFNFAEKTTYGFTTQLFGEGINANKIITYAGTFASSTIADIEKYNLKNEIQSALKNISAISVRDRHSFEMMKFLTDKNVEICIDPVFIYDFESEIAAKQDSDYVLIYSYQGRISKKEEIETIEKFARAHNKKLISVGSYVPWCNKNVICTPFELLAYFKYADFVITDTFHGSALSIKYNKQFATFVRNKQIGDMTANTNKLLFMLTQFALTDRVVDCAKKLPKILETQINYSNTTTILSTEICNSLNFILKSAK